MARRLRRLRRWFVALSAAVTVGLGATLGWVVIGLSGPETTVMDAQAAIRDQRFTKAIHLLDRAENSVGIDDSTALYARILYLRRSAHLALDNVPRAIDDIQALLELHERNPAALPAVGADPEALEMERIYYLLRAERVETALALAQRWLESHPDHARGLELAGEAAFASFAEHYRVLREQIDSAWEDETARESDEYLKVWLYRDESDPLARRNRDRFDALLREWQPTTAASGRFLSSLEDLKRKIQQAQDYCRRAIVAPGGQPVAAYQLLRTSLEKGGRTDDIQALAEIYCLLFDHVFTVDAACDLAELHLENGRDVAALEVCRRFLPRGAWRERLEAGRLSSVVKRLYVAEATALRNVGDHAAAEEMVAEVEEIVASGLLDLNPEVHLIRALCGLMRTRDDAMMTEIASYVDALEAQPRTASNREALYEATAVWMECGLKRRWGKRFFAALHKRLGTYGPPDPLPYTRASALYLEESNGVDALDAAFSALQVEAHNDEVLRALGRAYDFQDRRSGRGAVDLLTQFIQAGFVPANISRSELWPLIAEIALEKGLDEFALEAARRAATAFNWARWPRELEARAALALGQPQAAIEAAESMLTFHPGDPGGESLLERARLAAGLPVDDLLYGALVNRRDEARTAMTLLARARDRDATELADAIATKIERSFPDDAPAQAMIAEYFVERRQFERAQAAIGRTVEHSDPLSPLFAKTRAMLLLIAAISGQRADVPSLLEATKIYLHGQTDELYRYASSLAELDEGRSGVAGIASEMALELIEPVLENSIYAPQRTGVHYHFGGMLALRLGKLDDAKRYLLAALPFEEGVAASRALTLLNLREGRGPSPAETFLEQSVSDLVSACLHARAGRPVSALGWVDDTLQDEPANLPALCLRALFGEGARGVPDELQLLVDKAPIQLLDTLTFLEARGFESVAVTNARALVATDPTNRFAIFLAARALANAGDAPRALQLFGSLALHPPGVSPFPWAEPEIARLFEANLRDELIAAVVDSPAREQQLTLLANVWVNRPEHVSLADAEFLIENGRLQPALDVLEAMRPRLTAEQQPRAYKAYFDLVARLDALEPSAERMQNATRIANALVDTDTPLGSAVHFLLDREEATLGPLGDDRQELGRTDVAVGLLERHIAWYLAGNDPDLDALLRSLDRLRDLVDRRDLLRHTEAVLRFDPSLIDVWVRRAGWLSEDGLLEDAYDSVAWIRDYLPTSPAQLLIAELRARSGIGDANDLEILQASLPADVLESPRAALARGLVSFRIADYATAEARLAAALPATDGAHLYFRAIACLALGDRNTAAGLFAKLAESYPTSVLSENAEQFAKFLSQ